eukprot:TRINITY_DN3876_c0_g1_i1.p2 TRINITY_DN3876_c0_g1~~TRINITY_DN3876_c0_g1_i1.p2  ORF type:complete len:240 (-),score=54.03 TRINITY_DN3876_c0_g1_i1:366-1085(-)
MEELPKCLPGDVELVVFDMAGTTVDDVIDGVPLVIAALRAGFKAYNGTEVDIEKANAVRGFEKKEAVRQLMCSSMGLEREALDEAEVGKLFGFFSEELEKLTGQVSTEIAGSSATFATLKERGIKVCVGSGFAEHIVTQIVGNLGWTVDGVFSSVALGAGRPDPIMIAKAMETCGVTDPRKVVKVGDTVVDVEEGKNAGVFTVSVLTGTQSREKLAGAGPDCIIPSVADLPSLFNWAKL